MDLERNHLEETDIHMQGADVYPPHPRMIDDGTISADGQMMNEEMGEHLKA